MIQVRLDAELRDKLQSEADRDATSLSAIVRLILLKHFRTNPPVTKRKAAKRGR